MKKNCTSYCKILSVSILAMIILSSISSFVYFLMPVKAAYSSSCDMAVTFYPFQDAYVNEDDPDVNYGSLTYLWVTQAPNKRTYIQFDFSSIPSSVITSATLKLYQYNYEGSGDRTYDLYLVNNSWDEETITWNSLLGTTSGDVLTSSAIVNTSEGWKSWDVTFDVNACVNNISLPDHPYHGWMIRDHDEGISDSHGRQFASKDIPAEIQHLMPKLEVIYDVDDEPPIVTITSPENGTIFAEPHITVSGNVTDNIGIVSLSQSHSWNGGGAGDGGPVDPPVTDYSFTWNFTLYEGWNIISVSAQDVAGNYGNDNITIFYVPNNPPIILDQYPINGSIGQSRPPVELNVTVGDPDADAMDVYIRWRKHDYYQFGEWVTLEGHRGVYNGTYNTVNLTGNDWIWGNTTYFWSVNVTDGALWTNETYEYTTGGSRYDVSNNGIVNFQDAGLIWIHRTSEAPCDGIYDVNQDGQVNLQDAGLTWINRD